MTTRETGLFERRDIASESQIETVEHQIIRVTSEVMPWISEDMDISTVLVKLPTGQTVRYGSAMTQQAKKIMNNDWNIRYNDEEQVRDVNREKIEDRMNRGLWTDIGYILNGQARNVGRFIDCPIPAFYVKDKTTKARLFFASLGNEDGISTFVRIGSTFTVPGEKKLLTHITKGNQGTK